MWRNQKQQVMKIAGAVGWLWPGGSGTVVSGPSGSHSHFLFLSLLAVFYHLSIPARLHLLLPSCQHHILQ